MTTSPKLGHMTFWATSQKNITNYELVTVGSIHVECA